MLERLILFLVMGCFVFAPTIPNWTQTSMTSVYSLYLLWLLTILLVYFKPGSKKT